MNKKFGLSGLCFVAVILICGSAFAEGWWLKGGPVYRGGMEVEAEGSSRVQDLGVHAAGNLGDPSSVGNANRYDDRTYDDGYVKRDPGTGNPGSIDPDLTWYWGYDNASQYDSGRDTLTFHQTGAEGYSEVLNTTFTDDDKMDGYGAELVAGRPLADIGRLTLDVCVGLQGLWGMNANLSGSTYQEGVGRMHVTDTYDVSGVNMPGAGHEGTYDGPFDSPPVIPSPLIPNMPESRSSRLVDSQWTAENQINMDVESELYNLWLGSRLALALGERFSVHITPKISANYVNVDVDRSETFVATYADGSTATLNSWSDTGSESKWLFGAGATAGADVQFGNGYFAGIYGGYEWVADEVDVTVGPNTVSVDMSGYTAGVQAGKRF